MNSSATSIITTKMLGRSGSALQLVPSVIFGRRCEEIHKWTSTRFGHGETLKQNASQSESTVTMCPSRALGKHGAKRCRCSVGHPFLGEATPSNVCSISILVLRSCSRMHSATAPTGNSCGSSAGHCGGCGWAVGRPMILTVWHTFRRCHQQSHFTIRSKNIIDTKFAIRSQHRFRKFVFRKFGFSEYMGYNPIVERMSCVCVRGSVLFVLYLFK